MGNKARRTGRRGRTEEQSETDDERAGRQGVGERGAPVRPSKPDKERPKGKGRERGEKGARGWWHHSPLIRGREGTRKPRRGVL